MQQRAMLLVRSSSTPVLECLLAPLSHTESSSSDANNECLIASAGEPLCVSRHSNRAGSYLPRASHPHVHFDSALTSPAKSSSWKSSSESPSHGLAYLRKVQSENDLCSIGGGGGGGGGCSCTPARVAANTLLQDSHPDDSTAFDSYHSGCYLPHVKKGRVLLPLSRHSSLWSLPSVFFCGDSPDGDFAILEESELSTSSSLASEVDEDVVAQTFTFDKIALSVGEVGHAKHDHESALLLSKLNEGETSMSMPKKDSLQGLGCGKKAGVDAAGLDQVEMGVFADLELRESPPMSLSASSGMVSILERGLREPNLPLKHAFDGDCLEAAYSGGGGGGDRPPPITGGGRGGVGGDAGGHEGGKLDVADQHYQHVLQKDPCNPLLLQNYAQYLADVKHDYRKAEEYFQRAILTSPSDGELLGQYAKMLWEVKHDVERAAAYFERAVQAASDNSYVIAAYASFLWSSEEEGEEQQQGAAVSCASDFPASFPSLVSAGLA